MTYRKAHYKCVCGATKTITDRHGQQTFPEDVPCGWRGCMNRAVRYFKDDPRSNV